MSTNLRPLWDDILDLQGRFDKLCKDNNIRYYVTGGTLLGAIRHNGFIPWDDDFDVVMPRPDYDRLLDLVKNEQINGFIIKSDKYTQDFNLRHSQVKNAIGRGQIDVIPIDGMPKATIPFYYWALKRSTWSHRNEKNPIWKLLFLILWHCNKNDSMNFHRWLASYPYETSPCVEDMNANGKRFKMRTLSSASFGEPIMHEFDRIQVPIPQEWHKFLVCIFGLDYMTPPKKEDQKGH